MLRKSEASHSSVQYIFLKPPRKGYAAHFKALFGRILISLPCSVSDCYMLYNNIVHFNYFIVIVHSIYFNNTCNNTTTSVIILCICNDAVFECIGIIVTQWASSHP